MLSKKTFTFFLLGSSVTSDDVKILGSKLPTVRQVLRSFIAKHQELLSSPSHGLTKHNAATLTVRQQLVPIYGRAKIPTKDENNVAHAITGVYKVVEQLKKVVEKDI